ncbi:putative armadillo-like helical, importin beta family [Helianthus annuus]|nr:putative armadillo-like helical, importin beta family [Helianthus annuus]KAJ0628533.1 putative armadillo-like helical, importin beta family [Helianthus annuus]KAJ0949931.1 putative armadillo-like helical, importin beta family [Helianthus annuus]
MFKKFRISSPSAKIYPYFHFPPNLHPISPTLLLPKSCNPSDQSPPFAAVTTTSTFFRCHHCNPLAAVTTATTSAAATATTHPIPVASPPPSLFQASPSPKLPPHPPTGHKTNPHLQPPSSSTAPKPTPAAVITNNPLTSKIDLGPDLQVQYHQRVLPALATAMDGFNNPRVQEHFQKYYDVVMPYLKAILVNANDKANHMLRDKAMECISLVGMAVRKEKFRDDAKQVMEVLMSLQGSQMETDDPTTSYMLQSLQEPDIEICASMLDALNECIQVSGPLLDENQVRSIVDEIKQVITASSSRKTERAEGAKAEDFDTEEGELLKEENEQLEEVFDQVLTMLVVDTIDLVVNL